MRAELPEGTTDHPINRNRKDKILVSVWDFGPKYPQGERAHYVCNNHPAKMRPTLARAILQLYGESPVLDPMAGIGATLIEAMLLGLDVVGVELVCGHLVEPADREIPEDCHEGQEGQVARVDVEAVHGFRSPQVSYDTDQGDPERVR